MRYCKRCLYPDTKPQLIFNQDRICSACINYEKKKTIDWDKKRKEFELRRKQRVEPHRVLFFFQSNDPYSTLAAQFLHQIQASYAVKLEIHLVGEEGYDALPEPEMYRKYVFSDVQKIAPYYGIDFANTRIPSPEEKNRFLSHLCSLNQEELIQQLPSISLEFWKGKFSGNTSSDTIIKDT